MRDFSDFSIFYEQIEKENREHALKIQSNFNFKNIHFVTLFDENEILLKRHSLIYDVFFIKNTFVFFADLYHDLRQSNYFVKDKIKQICGSVYEQSKDRYDYNIDEINESITIEKIKQLVSSGAISKYYLTQVNYYYSSISKNYYITSNLRMKDTFLNYDLFIEGIKDAIKFIEQYECLHHLAEKVTHLHTVNRDAYLLNDKIVTYGIDEIIKKINKIN